MLLLGIDLGTSSIKVSVVDGLTGKKIVSCAYPETEAEIIGLNPGWAEQDPELWWLYTTLAIKKANETGQYDPKAIGAIGIAYQMHGLVLVDKEGNAIRNSIIWCDSRAVDIGHKANINLADSGFLDSHLNSPGNFTASKLAWVKQNEPENYKKIAKFMLPGDFLSMKLTGEINTNLSSLSEGVLWNFKKNELSSELLDYFGISADLVPEIKPVFSTYGKIRRDVAQEIGLSEQVVVSYKAGDQPNNALSLNVFNAGDVAATAGTSGVIYAVTDQLKYDKESRVNTFAHVNHGEEERRLGVLLCINGTGIQNSWMRQMTGSSLGYDEINAKAAQVAIGADGLVVLPFGNGAERMLNNRNIGSSIENLDFVRHGKQHLWRASQEGIACAFRFGLDILKQTGVAPKVVKAGYTNLFLSPVFREAFSGITGLDVELYDLDGSVGAALGAGLGINWFSDKKEMFTGLTRLLTVTPEHVDQYEETYLNWKKVLDYKLKN